MSVERVKQPLLVACWDWDNTPASTEQIAYIRQFGAPNSGLPEPSVRDGMPELLQKTSQERGFTHVVVTSADQQYIDVVLQVTELAPYFQRTFGPGSITATASKGSDKYYGPVRDVFGFTDDQARKRMIVLGDKATDKASDIEGLVFIDTGLYGYKESLSATVFGEIFSVLLQEGNGEFNAGFFAVFDKATPLHPQRREHSRIYSHSGISFQLTNRVYTNKDSNKITIPTIDTIKAPQFIRPNRRLTNFPS